MWHGRNAMHPKSLEELGSRLRSGHSTMFVLCECWHESFRYVTEQKRIQDVIEEHERLYLQKAPYECRPFLFRERDSSNDLSWSFKFQNTPKCSKTSKKKSSEKISATYRISNSVRKSSSKPLSEAVLDMKWREVTPCLWVVRDRTRLKGCNYQNMHTGKELSCSSSPQRQRHWRHAWHEVLAREVHRKESLFRIASKTSTQRSNMHNKFWMLVF